MNADMNVFLVYSSNNSVIGTISNPYNLEWRLLNQEQRVDGAMHRLLWMTVKVR
jgi:hypothetical protein